MHNYERGSLKQINVKWVDLSISRIINTMYKPDGMTIPHTSVNLLNKLIGFPQINNRRYGDPC